VVLVSHGRTVAEGTVADLNARADETDFEEAFVKLAFSPQEREAAS
jgi:sodium transport system ATP-binding protein